VTFKGAGAGLFGPARFLIALEDPSPLSLEFAAGALLAGFAAGAP